MNKQFSHLPKNISLRFRDYSLRTKLLLAFLAVTIIPLVVVFYLNNRSTTQNLTDNANTALSGAAAQTAATLDTFIATGLDNVRVAAQSHIWEEYLALPPAERASSQSEQVLYIDLRALASLDQTYIDAVGLMDKNGIDVADTAKADIGSNKSTHRYVAEPLRTGLPYSTVQFSPTTHKLSLYFSAPVHDANGNIIGVLRFRYNESVLQSVLVQSAASAGVPDGAVDLLDENHIFLGSTDGPSEILKTVALLPAEKLAQLQAELRLPEGSAESFSLDKPDLEQDLNRTDQQPIFTIESEGEQAAAAPLKNQPWVVLYAQPQSTYLAPLTAQTRTAIVTALIIAVLAAAAAVFVSQFLTGPLVRLAAVAEQVAAGDINVQAKVESADESGTLAAAFNNMTSRLRELIGSLEQGTQSLKLAAEVGRSVSQVRALDVMLKDAAELIRSRFDLYYVQVYLTDPSQTNLILKSGTGTVGAELLGRAHRLPLNTASINGRAAIEKRSVVVADTAASATFKPNPLLPDTRSEMAVPLLIGEKVVGVLDMQSQQANALNQEILPAFEALAGQLAIAIQNANFLAETQQARAEVETQARRLTRTNWIDYLDAIHKPEETGFVFQQNKIVPMTQLGQSQPSTNGNALTAPITVTGETLGNLVVDMEGQSPIARTDELINTVAQQVARQIESLRLLDSAERYRVEAEEASRRLTREGWKNYTQENAGGGMNYIYDLKEVRPFNQNGDQQTDESATIVPLNVRDETIGKLVIQGLGSGDKASLELANTVAERLGVHIENLRLAAETEQAFIKTKQLSRQNELILDSAGEGIFGLDVKGNHTFINPAAADMLGYTVEELIGRHSHSTWHHTKPDGSPYPSEECPIYRSINTGIEQRGNELFIRKDGSRMDVAFTATPIFEGDRVVGAVVTFTDITQQKREQENIAQRAKALSAVAEISSASTRELDIQKMLETVVYLTQRKFGLYHAHVFIYNENADELKLAACGWKEGDIHEGTHGTAAIPLNQEQSLVARAARTRQAVIANDVHNEPGWLPNPLLPDTASELAVPLLIGDQVLGILDVQADRINAFTEDDANIQIMLASQVATSLQNARSFVRAQQQADRESTLNLISQKIQGATTVEAALQIAARELGRVLQAPLTIAQLGLKGSDADGNGMENF